MPWVEGAGVAADAWRWRQSNLCTATRRAQQVQPHLPDCMYIRLSLDIDSQGQCVSACSSLSSDVRCEYWRGASL